MAEEFGVDAQAAGRTGSALVDIRSTVTSLDTVLGGQGEVTGSARVQQALADFVADSSDARERMDGQLERAAGMLSGLATGATTLDGALAQAVTPENPPAPVAPTAAAPGRPVGSAV